MRSKLLVAAALVAVPAAVASSAARFGALYRERAGFPPRVPVTTDPAAAGLPWTPVAVPSAGRALPGWFIPAAEVPGAGSGARPGVTLVHGWGSNRARMLPIAAFLRAAGFHTLAFDVRGHGDNPPESMPVTAVEFGEDAAAAIKVLRAHPGVERVGVLGHSMGGVGASLAAAAEEGAEALVVVSAPADPRMLVRETFRLADLPLPAPIAHPLAWVALRATLRPRGHRPEAASARRAVARYGGPVLLVQGDADEILPLRDLRLLERAAAGRTGGARTEVLVIPGGRHRWLYEDSRFRRTVAAFLAESLGGPSSVAEAAQAAAATPTMRPSDTEAPLVPDDIARRRRRSPAGGGSAGAETGDTSAGRPGDAIAPGEGEGRWTH